MDEIERILHEALALPPDARAAFLDAACPEGLRRDVESLLSAETLAGKLFAPPVEAVGPTAWLEDFGETGPYTVLEKLGEGGMGVVFRARQSEPVSREVALKVIRAGMATQGLLARFWRERQALAMMDHPNIARVYDAGSTSRGLPYLVMELVSGRTIQNHCNEHKLSVRRRVELAIPVCLAIQHAHQKGIIHRDIKPSNVLVTEYDGRAVPKVIDFGIARAIEPAEGATRAGLMVGTFEYVSPEQAEAGATDIDTRTDVYSLGALLYLLVTGRTPIAGLSLERSSYLEILRRLREEVPQAASAVASAPALGELDWILAKALEKDRERRYATAEAMAKDLQRYLDGDALEAGPPSQAYRLRKLVAKHRFGLAVFVAGLVLLLVSLGWMAFALRQQKRANKNADALREVVRKLMVDRPEQLAQEPNRTALRGQLMRDAEAALKALSQDSSSDEGVQLDLANAYLATGKAKGAFTTTGSEGSTQEGMGYVREAISRYDALVGKHPKDVKLFQRKTAAEMALLTMHRRVNEFDAVIVLGRKIMAQVDALPPDMASVFDSARLRGSAGREVALVLWNLGRTDESIVIYRQIRDGLRQAHDEQWLKADPAGYDYKAVIETDTAISEWLYGGYSPVVEEGMRRGVELAGKCSLPNCKMRLAEMNGVLGQVVWASGNVDEGTRLLRESVTGFETAIADDPANRIYQGGLQESLRYLVVVLAQNGDSRGAVDAARKLDGADINHVIRGTAFIAARNWPQAEAELRLALKTSTPEGQWGPLHRLGAVLDATGRPAEALVVRRQDWELARVMQPPTFSTRFMQALSARDFLKTPGVTSQEREQVETFFKQCCQALELRYAALAGPFLERY